LVGGAVGVGVGDAVGGAAEFSNDDSELKPKEDSVDDCALDSKEL